ncbi:MAG: amino acid adenylation domain-containing protein [Leptolyngbya sp. SIO1E4]|nr:amino acid adenylation domain-containing protein [Leptolyngbya sp. SIO1E4]
MKADNIEDIYELSPAQQGILFHSLYAPDSGVYITQRCLLLKGTLDIAAFAAAWQHVLTRHTALRTSFHWENLEKALQVVHKDVRFPFEQYDWRALPVANQQTQLVDFLKNDRHKDFDLSQPPLIRLSLIQLTDNTYQIVLSEHHLILDGWSNSLMFKEFIELYQVLSQGQDHLLNLLPPSRPYGEYIAWLQQQNLSKAEAFWRRLLSGIKAPTPLVKGDVGKLSEQEESYNYESLELSIETSEALQAFARQHHLTLNTLFQAAWAVLLSRYSGLEDVLYGDVVSGRPVDLKGVEAIVGLFLNTLPMRVEVSPDQPLVAWLKQLQAQQVEMRQYEYSPLVEIQKWSEIPPSSPLFESIVVFENHPLPQFQKEHGIDLEVQNSEIIHKLNYPLSVLFLPPPDAGFRIYYDCHRFDAPTIRRMMGHLQVLLQGMVTNPEMLLKDLSLLTPAEKHQLVREWNNTQVEYPSELCIHQLFEVQTEKTPESVAVTFEGQQLTYRELNQKANQLAHHLQGLGVGSEVLVGICVERSLEMIIGLLGILKTGGAYVPLDPSYPQERLSYMLADSGIGVLLTQEPLLKFISQNQAQVVSLDTDWRAIEQQSQENLEVGVCSDNLAYVIYTSGSTGEPKGVLVEHKNVVRLFAATQPWYHFNANDVWTNFHSIAFDFSVWEVWGALLHGGCLIIVPYWISRDPQSFYDLLCSKKVTVLNQTPSAFRQLINVEKPDDRQPQLNLRLVIFGGEALEIQSLKPWFEQYGDQSPQLVNMYGITETTVHVTYRPLTIKDLNKSGSVIGCPITDLQIYILDDNLQLVPIGVKGQMYVGGAGLARGYLNRQQLTLERFIPNPFDHQLEGRLYMTGDLARYLPNGDIEYLGRIDNQVKIRGFRIELGEIEATLAQYPNVQENVVIAHSDHLGGKYLVAYVVSNQAQAPTNRDLRRFLSKTLPDYMVPSAFVVLEKLPLTPNGKVDRKVLQAPDMARSEAMGTFVAPLTDVEVVLADVWAQVLRLEKIGIHDNFFELGGDSILSIQIISRVNQAGLQLTLQQMFEHQTIAELAAVATTERKIQAEQGLVTGEVPLTPIQHWFSAQNLPEAHHWNQSILLEIHQALAPVWLQQTVQILLGHHDALRMRFEPHQATGWQQWVSHPDVETPLTLFDLSTVAEADQSLAVTTAAAELQASLDLATGPLMRVAYFDLGANRSARLLWVIHHLAVDGVSWRILLEDFQRVYKQLSQGEKSQLPPKTTSFQYWAERLQQYGQSEVLQQELDYWLKESRRPVTTIPVDFAEGENTVAEAGVVSVALSQADTQALLQEVPKAYQTQINDVLLTAVVQAFARWRGERSLWLDLEGHGREDLFEEVDLSRTVGWFTVLFPICLELSESDDPGEALKAIKEQLRSIPNRGIGYGVLRYLTREEPIACQLQSRSEIVFNYLGQADQGVQASSLVAPAPESTGFGQSLRGSRSHLLNINSIVAGGQLRLNWTYSKAIHRRTTIETLAERCIEALQLLITHCQSLEAGDETFADAQLVNVAPKESDRLIKPVPRNGHLPLSFAQARLWFLEQLASGRYNEPAAVRLEGVLNVTALEQSFNEIVRRHEVFRTTFPVVDGHPRQWISPSIEVSLPVVNLCALSAAEQESESQRLVEEWSQRTFDLAQDPLLRIALLKLGEHEHLVMFSTHHIIYDRWSMGLLIKELAILYQAFSQGQPSPLPALPTQYADFAVWQSQWLQGDVLENQLSYWRQQLAGAPATLNLQKIAGNPPLDTGKQEVESQPSAAHSFQLSKQLSEQLKILSRKQRVTLFMTLLSALQTLLYRYTNQSDIVIGTDVAGRNRVEIESLIGFFINLLVLRTDLSGNPTFRELLGRVREVTLGAYAHQDLPFAKLVESLRPDRTNNTTPLFQVLFVLQNVPGTAVEFSGLTLTPVEVARTQARFDLVLFVVETEQGLFGNWRYRTDLFEPAAIARLSRHLQMLLSSIVQNPDTHIDTLEMFSESEKQQQITQKVQRERAQFKKFKTIKPKAVSLPQKELVKTGYLQPEQSLPYVIQPDDNEIDLADWATNKREFIETNLLKHGAILFRGFKINSVPAFEKVANAICPNLFGNYGDLPREGVSENVYGSTPYPADQAILFHNESSHLHQWPLKIWFFCVKPAQNGGETPIVDCRKVYQKLAPKLRERFEQKQLRYARNYIEGLDVSWQDFFHTSDKEAVETYCRQSGIDCEWLSDSHLRTYKLRPAISCHPKTEELVFFNQVQLHHISCLESAVRTSLLSALEEDNLPRNVYYGDGSPIEDSVMAEIGAVYEQTKISFPWEQGDILMLDNMLVAHGRNPYVGSRKIVVAMGEIIDSKRIEGV